LSAGANPHVGRDVWFVDSGLGVDMEEPEKPKRKPRRKPDDVTKFERLFANIRSAAFDKTLPDETSEKTAPRKPPEKR